MKEKIKENAFILIIDTIIIMFSILSLMAISQKAVIPEPVSDSKSIDKISVEHLHDSDVIKSINGIDLSNSNREFVEFCIDKQQSGDYVEIEVDRKGEQKTINIQLVNYYDLTYLIVLIISGLFFLVPAFFILLNSSDKYLARLFHGVMFTIFMMLSFTYGTLAIFPTWINLTLRTLADISFLLVPATMIHLSLFFPRPKYMNIKTGYKYVYVLVSVLSIPIVIVIYNYLVDSSLESIQNYDLLKSNILNPIVIPCFFFALFNFFHSYIISKVHSDKAKLLWIFLGLLPGPALYVILYRVTELIYGAPVMSETVMIAMLIITPVSLMIAILKYEFIDIRLFYKRSVVYGIVLTFLALIYIGIIYLFSLFVHREFENMVGIPNAIAAFVNILLFNFIRNKVQKFVDRKFFKVSYDFGNVQSSFLKELKTCYSSLSVYQLINRTLEDILPLENFDFMLYSKEEDDLWLVNKSDSFVDQNYLYQIKEICKTNLSGLPIAASKSVDKDVEYKLNNSIFEHSPHSLFVMSINEEGNLVNVLAIGRKKSGLKFRYEDIALLQLFATESGNAIQRLELQRNLLFQKEETKKLEELNEMKSFFVSSVSHELKTPMTSIKLFAELMNNNQNLELEKRKEYLNIIQSECDRLNRLISNVLDFAKIERGTKEYRFELIDLNDITRSIIEIMRYRIDFLGFELIEEISDDILTIHADKDAITEVIMNLISNSLKYYKENKFISIKTFSKADTVCLEISDKGIGISEDDQKKIFDAFYRSRSKQANQAGGTGIGLSIVKHIMEVHQGTIELDSVVGEGSKFSMFFPKEVTNE